MAKRFTDTGKWDKAWFRKLTPEYKCAWAFLCDRCDHAGVWEVDVDALHFFVGAEITVDQLISAFDGRVILANGNKVLIEGFAEFQYGHLNPENRVHKSVITRLEKLTKKKVLNSPLKGAKDKETETDADTDTEKDEDSEIPKFDLDIRTREIFESIPLVTRDTLALKFSPAKLAEGLEDCVSYHLNDPASSDWRPDKWGKKIMSWFIDKKQRDKKKPNSNDLDDLDLTAKEPA